MRDHAAWRIAETFDTNEAILIRDAIELGAGLIFNEAEFVHNSPHCNPPDTGITEIKTVGPLTVRIRLMQHAQVDQDAAKRQCVADDLD